MARVLGAVRKLPGPLHEFLCSTIEQSKRVYYIARQYLISMLFQRWNQKKKKKSSFNVFFNAD